MDREVHDGSVYALSDAVTISQMGEGVIEPAGSICVARTKPVNNAKYKKKGGDSPALDLCLLYFCKT